jgi:hypothetical protein
MSAVEHLFVLHNNPFLFARAMMAFFESVGNKEHALILAYLVLPIILDEDNRRVLGRARPNSNLRTFIGHRERMRSLPKRVAHYREITNSTLRYLFSLKAIESVDDTVLVARKETVADQVTLDGLIKAAQVLGRFFRDHPVPAIYRMVGVMSL